MVNKEFAQRSDPYLKHKIIYKKELGDEQLTPRTVENFMQSFYDNKLKTSIIKKYPKLISKNDHSGQTFLTREIKTQTNIPAFPGTEKEIIKYKKDGFDPLFVSKHIARQTNTNSLRNMFKEKINIPDIEMKNNFPKGGWFYVQIEPNLIPNDIIKRPMNINTFILREAYMKEVYDYYPTQQQSLTYRLNGSSIPPQYSINDVKTKLEPAMYFDNNNTLSFTPLRSDTQYPDVKDLFQVPINPTKIA
ncbi:hypothetical protein KJ980_04815 [Patescibacteria group bacterium]|nr:hypothetical protein [Patescibacteria group bacterium]MBU4098940.1 hypothetical protein [Patescibacteria group bacterium]